MSKVSDIHNLGPASDEFFGKAGVTTEAQLRELGPDEAYFQALAAGGRPHFIGYYAMVMGLQGRMWNDCQGPEKDALKDRFNAIKARLKTAPKTETAIDADLSKIGVVKKT